MSLMVAYSIRVKAALMVHDASALSQTPFSFRRGVIANNAPMGNTRVPRKETSMERAGRSSAVK